MKSKRETLNSIQRLYSEYMRIWTFLDFGLIISSNLIPYEYSAKEEPYLIANAANKFWNLINI